MSGAGDRVPVTLVCSVCGARNYKKTKVASAAPLTLRKFCATCGRHTEHVESR